MPTLRKYWTAQIGVNHCHVDFRVYLGFELLVGDSRARYVRCRLPLASSQYSQFSCLSQVQLQVSNTSREPRSEGPLEFVPRIIWLA